MLVDQQKKKPDGGWNSKDRPGVNSCTEVMMHPTSSGLSTIGTRTVTEVNFPNAHAGETEAQSHKQNAKFHIVIGIECGNYGNHLEKDRRC